MAKDYKWEDATGISDEEEPRKIKQSGSSRMGPAGNEVSPPERSAYSGGQSAGDKSTGKGFGEKYSKPGEQPFSNRAYRGGQAAGTKGFSSNEKFKP